MDNVGSRLRETRHNAGLSQEEIALLMFMPRSTISKLENNKMVINIKDFVRWLQVTQVPEAAAAVVCGVDLVALSQMLTTFLGGFINLL